MKVNNCSREMCNGNSPNKHVMQHGRKNKLNQQAWVAVSVKCEQAANYVFTKIPQHSRRKMSSCELRPLES